MGTCLSRFVLLGSFPLLRSISAPYHHRCYCYCHMALSCLQQLDPVFSPWENSPPSSCLDNKMSTSGDMSSTPEEGIWDDELLALKLAEKLLETRQEPLDFLDKYSSGGEDLLDNVQPQHDAGSRVISWDEDYIDQTYRRVNPRFKTEICRNFKEKGTCLYGDLCQFAHGNHELRKDVVRHSKYKTKLCQKYWIAGYCAYGPRCNFIHQEIERDQALRILGARNEKGGRVSMQKTTSSAYYPVTGHHDEKSKVGFRKEAMVVSAAGDYNSMERNFSKLGLGGFGDRVSPSGSPVDFDVNIADLLPSNFGLGDGFKEKEMGFSRRPIGSERFGREVIGSERFGREVTVWNEVWTSL